jgi:SnoaL-like domain
VETYAQRMDAGDPDGFLDLFLPDGALVVFAPGREKPMGAFRGSGATGVGLVAKLLGELYRDTMHHITNNTVDVDGDEAVGTTYCLAYHLLDGEDGGTIETLGVRYVDEFTRTPQGWRFRTRNATRMWSQIESLANRPLAIDRAAGALRRERAEG